MQAKLYDYMKRFLDTVSALILLIILSPVFLAISLLVIINLGRPVLFRQVRTGKDGLIFTLYKFRTMTVGDSDDADRLTPFGRVLRATSLDELPELINILKGDMSLVGPRPLLPEYLPLYNTQQARRHEVRPGLTGLAQVSGRNALTWEERFEYDVKYVDTRSFMLDNHILARTISTVFGREGISDDTSVTMESFRGQEMTG